METGQVNSSNYTSFKDTIYKYIRVNEKIVSDFIDVDVFQRLKRIEQSNVKQLYPCASHNRFQHSLGTFYLACKVSGYLLKKFKDTYDFLEDEYCKKKFKEFEIASLLHDVGHAPFSHTTENFFAFGIENSLKIPNKIIEELFE